MGKLRKKTKPQAATTTVCSKYICSGSLSSEKTAVSIAIDGEMAKQLHRLSHKNRSAKLKALAAVSRLFKQKPEKETVNMMHQWAFIYRKLLLDYDEEVRLAAHGTMTDIVIALGQDLNPHIKTLIGPWWFSQFDPVHQVSQAAKSLFETAFPASERRILALTSFSTGILTYVEENLKLTPQSFSDGTETEQMHQQVLTSSLLALAALLDMLPFQNSAKSTSSETVELIPATDAAVEKLFTSNKYFTGFFKSQSPVVRMTAYSTVISCIKHSVSHAFDAREVVKLVFPAILGCFQENNPDCQTIWEVLLVFMKTFPESWNAVNVQKDLLHPLWEFLKNGCYGSQQVLYPTFVTFLDTLPPHNSITGDEFFLDFFHNLWAGRNLSCSSDDADRLAFFVVIEECFLWALRNASRYCDGKNAIRRFKRRLVDEILIGLLWNEYHKIVSSAYIPSHGIQLTRARDIGECIFKLFSRLQHDLLMVVSLKFQADCLETLNLKKHKHSQDVHWVVRFLLLMDKHAVQKGETWPFDLVRPAFQAIQEFDSPDSVQLRKVAVSIFGQRKILCKIACSSDPGNENLPRDSFNKIVVPWCLKDFNDFKLDLLLAVLLDNEESSFLEEWDVVVNYLVDLVTACGINSDAAVDDRDHLSVFARLMNKTREINRRQISCTPKPATGKCDYHVLDLMKKVWKMTRWKSSSASRSVTKWHHDRLESFAVSLVLAGPPYKKSNAQFVSAVLGGGLEDDKSLLSRSRQILVLEEVRRNLLLYMMDSTFVWVRDLCSSLVDKTSYSGWKTEESCLDDSPYMAGFALDILSGSIFCLKNIEDENEELIEGILAAIFIIDWEFNLVQTMYEGGLSKEELEKVFRVPLLNTKSFATKHYSWIVNDLRYRVFKSFDAKRRKSFVTKLIEFAIRAVFMDNDDDAFVSDKFSISCCKWILDIFQVFCVDRLEQQQLLDQLLSKNECWPTWITADSKLSRAENVHPQNMNLMAVLDKLLPRLGYDELVARPWLVVEFLCTWKWIGGSALGTFLPSFLGYMKAKDDSSEFFHNIITVLLDGAIAHQGDDSRNRGVNHLFWLASFEEIGTVEEPYLRALLSLLSTLFRDKIWGKEKALSLFEHLVNRLHSGDTDVNLNYLSILPFVMNILVGTQFLDEHAGFQSAAVNWLERTIAFPPLNQWEPGKDIEDWFKLIIACFPISETGRKRRKVDVVLESVLYKLFQKQERACSPFSAHVNKMLPPSSVQMLLLSKLMVISAAYCGVREEDWIFILSCSRDWIDSAVVIMKQIAENVNDMSMNDSVVDAAALCSKLGNNAAINNCLTTALSAVVTFSLPCNIAPYSSVIERTQGFGTKKVLENYLSLFFSTATAEALAYSNGHREEASSVIALFRFDHRRLWELVGSYVSKTTSRMRESAEKSMLELGSSKEPIASLYALLFSCKPLPPLQYAAFELLSTVPFVRSALTFAINNQSSSADGNVFGLREEISCILQRSPQVSKMDLLAHERVNVFVAWGLVLTCLTSLSSNSSIVARRRAIQGVADLMDPMVVLDCLFQHIPVEQRWGTSSTMKYRELASAAGNAAKHAIVEGSTLFALKALWPVDHERMASLSGAVFGLMLCNFPAYVRRWWDDVRNPYLSEAYELFINSWCSEVLVSYESSHATPAAYKGLEVMAIYTKDDASIQLIIHFPPSYPLSPVGFYHGVGSLGIDEQKLNEWLNSLKSLDVQNATLEEAIGIWKSNIDKEFEGVEDCPICYCTFREGTYRFPDVACSTCKHLFHNTCIDKWLSDIDMNYGYRRKNTCPLCKSSFYPPQHR